MPRNPLGPPGGLGGLVCMNADNDLDQFGIMGSVWEVQGRGESPRKSGREPPSFSTPSGRTAFDFLARS